MIRVVREVADREDGLELASDQLDEDVILRLLRYLGRHNLPKLQVCEGLSLLDSKGTGVFARNDKATLLRIEVQDMHADHLAYAEVILGVMDVCLAHLRDGQKAAELTVELCNCAMLQDVDDGSESLQSYRQLIVRLDGGLI